jgi:hypothetical protein
MYNPIEHREKMMMGLLCNSLDVDDPDDVNWWKA